MKARDRARERPDRRREGRPASRDASREASRDASRDQQETAFAAILGALVARVPGARAAALVDFHGETVDYTGRMVPFDLRIAAAHWRIVLHDAEAQPSLSSPLLSPASKVNSTLRWFVVALGRSSYLIYALPDGYALIVVFARMAGFAGWQRATAACARSLGTEAGWASSPAPRVEWWPLRVMADERGRPRSVRWAGRSHPVEILGKIVSRAGRPEHHPPGGVSEGERGWRVRLQTGVEATLIREPGGAWYSDESFDDPAAARAPQRASRKTR